MKRRVFLEKSMMGALTLTSPGWAGSLVRKDRVELTLLHTNDMHSRIEPFPMDGSRNEGLGGMARRATFVKEMRALKKNVVLLDSGDIFQGTPYFNQFGGELEFRLMSEMGYDAATIGNHDFDGGLQNLAVQMQHASFDMLSCNYDFSGTSYAGYTKKNKIINVDGVKVGVTGVGIELDGLVPSALTESTKFLDPIQCVNEQAVWLKKEGCHLVVVLSHLGYKYGSDRVSDVVLAQQTRNVDLILGGHTHTFMDAPDIQYNKEGKKVVIHQNGWAGIRVGVIDICFEKGSGEHQIEVSSKDLR